MATACMKTSVDTATNAHHDPSHSPSLKIHQSLDPLLSYTESRVHSLIQCSSDRRRYQHMLLPELCPFIRHVYYRCRLTPTILIVALIYLQRLKSNLSPLAQGEYDTPYKLFLAAVLVASKYIEDHSACTSYIYHIVSLLYTRRELNEMERSFLGVLKFDLFIGVEQIQGFLQENQDVLGLELDLTT